MAETPPPPQMTPRRPPIEAHGDTVDGAMWGESQTAPGERPALSL